MKFLYFSAVFLFVCSGAVRTWFNPSGSHGTRQVDTYGMSMALAHDIKAQGINAVKSMLYFPKILQRGFSTGIQATEFPLLNLMSWPFFLIGPHWGCFLSSLLILVANLPAAFWGLRKLLRGFEMECSPIFSAVLYFSTAAVTFENQIMMPEGLAFPALIFGMGYALEALSKQSHRLGLIASILISIAVTTKPTAVLGLFVILASSHFWNRKSILSTIVYGICALIFPAWWYGPHTHEILRHLDGPQLFATAEFVPWRKIREPGFLGVLDLLYRQIHHEQFPIYVGLGWLALGMIYEPVLALCLILALLSAISLDGNHIWNHFYYFFGASAISLVLMARLVKRNQNHVLGSILLVSLLWGVLYSIRTNVWITARSDDRWSFSEPFRKTLPENAFLVTDDTTDPTKLLFLGKIGVIAGLHALKVCDQMPFKDKQFYIAVDQSLVEISASRPCLEQAKELASIQSPFAHWKLFFIQNP